MATKNSPREILAILRQFEVAGVANVPREITQVKEQNPKGDVRVISFIFENIRYFIIIDSHANDDRGFLMEYILPAYPDIKGHFVRNPKEDSFTTYGISHKFRDVYLFKSEPSHSRLDHELARRYPEISRSTLQKYIKAGYVTVKGKVVTKPKHDVTENDDIAVQPPEKQDFSDQELPIVYIDDRVIVINKPHGVLTHSKGALNDEFTVADFMRRYTHTGLETNRPGIVHRLDRDTSGIIIGARDEESMKLLKKQFSDRTVKKSYLAIVEGVPKIETAIIDLPIGRNPSAQSTFRVDPSGKSAKTTYKVLATDGKRSLVLLKPETGRTHQLRVHMKHINTPIVGDRVYGKSQPGQRLYLHALELEITTPPSKRQVFKAAAPAEFVEIFKEARDV